ncbi:MAG: single-stranded-DNA-specific exonuclease RecJ [Anaerolineae bacterium]|nr:single-stranded-DNA-specific exonuclease RecJ [Anaerolineae bacterium]
MASTKRWQLLPKITQDSDAALHGYPPILRQILFNRGYASHESARQFLEARIPYDTNPFQLKGVAAAVERIIVALENNHRIAIYGDYDADGVTATALLSGYLKARNADTISYIPDRFSEGYGLNNKAIDHLKENGVQLIITVDCGIRSLQQVNYAHNLGIDLIITDHHTPGELIPNAIAVIDPKQNDDQYPDKNLAGVGLAYKLTAALDMELNHQDNLAESFLDLVAIGTISDLAPLIKENRYLVRLGIEKIHQSNRQGLLSLIGVAGLKAKNITAVDVGFGLGPRINAAGRMGSALNALSLLETDDAFEAAHLAQELDNKNRQRQKQTKEMQILAESIALSKENNPILLFASDPSFNPGIVGLAASQLCERYYRPALVAHKGDEYTRASCRSIPEFHITDALDQCADILTQHGGHAAAAGFTVHNSKLDQLIERLTSIAVSQLHLADLHPTIIADIELPLKKLRPELLSQLNWLQPTGYGNPQPIFISRNLKVLQSRTVGNDRSHLKLSVSDGYITFDAIAFRQGNWHGKLPDQVDLLYRFESNEFRGQTSLQLNVIDIKPSA